MVSGTCHLRDRPSGRRTFYGVPAPDRYRGTQVPVLPVWPSSCRAPCPYECRGSVTRFNGFRPAFPCFCFSITQVSRPSSSGGSGVTLPCGPPARLPPWCRTGGLLRIAHARIPLSRHLELRRPYDKDPDGFRIETFPPDRVGVLHSNRSGWSTPSPVW